MRNIQGSVTFEWNFVPLARGYRMFFVEGLSFRFFWKLALLTRYLNTNSRL